VAGGTVTIDGKVDPVLAGTQLVIPPGAVPDGTLITISRGDEQTGGGETSVSPSVRLGPDGLVLSKQATLFVPYQSSKQPSYSTLIVEISSKGVRSKQNELLVSPAAGLAQMQIGHFSDYEVVATPCPTEIVDQIDFATVQNDLAVPAHDMSQPPDMGSAGPPDLASGGASDFGPSQYDFGPSQYDFGPIPDYDLGYPTWDDGIPYDGGYAPSVDLAPSSGGYAPPAQCTQPDVVDLAVPPKG
jgi:hypothetical protein